MADGLDDAAHNSDPHSYPALPPSDCPWMGLGPQAGGSEYSPDVAAEHHPQEGACRCTTDCATILPVRRSGLGQSDARVPAKRAQRGTSPVTAHTVWWVHGDAPLSCHFRF